MKYQTGEIYYVNLDPAKGTEQKKNRPCVIVSNANYNQYFNTVIVVPISSSKKFLTEQRFLESPLFIQLNENHGVHGTILTQHLRAVDPSLRITDDPLDHLTVSELSQVNQALTNFFNAK